MSNSTGEKQICLCCEEQPATCADPHLGAVCSECRRQLTKVGNVLADSGFEEPEGRGFHQ